ncbi:unnamed protein product (macronuclear) [Paramecium tetraurelia]|uniref:Uncharacterized protein n=1 Tax=Paramecium tetraurelia TaxID=5888 RepID=A0CBI7_PARTE|nr:uncharacterized protein GSPATT00036937001 [Paramecium tetraurelia]CAK68154.1 unnamed protein product [Paramecium tetraurelia]|eukprot:XP_001435551.1 hypothetical protein (macronuclear) [Paramecium tetraurelia strain d4-2]
MQIKEELINVIINLIEELFECKINSIMQEVNDKLTRMHQDIENMQDVLVKHFSHQIAHSRTESLSETVDTAEEDQFKKSINAELDSLGLRVQQLEYMNHIILDTQSANKSNFKELERKIQPLQEQINKSIEEMKKDLKDKQTFQWTVLNDQIERVEKYVQKLKQADLLFQQKQQLQTQTNKKSK